MGGAFFALAVPGAAGAGTEAPAAPFALRLSAPLDAARLPGGPDSVGGRGDYALGNGVLCAVISGPEHEDELSVHGGALVDLGHCGRGDDQLVLFRPLVNASRGGVLPPREIRTAVSPDAAEVSVLSEGRGLALVTTYRVDRTDPARLLVVSRLSRVGEGPRVFALADAFLNFWTLRPFGLWLADLRHSVGFRHRPFFGAGSLAVARASEASDLHVLVGARGIEPGISYGFRFLGAERLRPGHEPEPLPRIALSDDVVSVLGALTRPLFFGGGLRLGLPGLLQTRLMDLRKGEELVYEREIRLGRRSDVASVTDGLFEALAGGVPVRGRVGDPAARLHFDLLDAGGRVVAPVTELAPGAAGAFELRLPPGDYRVRVVAPTGRELERRVGVGAGGADLGELAPPPDARLRLPRHRPMRLVFLGREGTPDPDFGRDGLGFTVVGRSVGRAPVRGLALCGRAADPAWVPLRPGRYRVLATRGPEYSVTEAAIELAAGEERELEIADPVREVESPGWISADLHVHAAPSMDSAVPLGDRLCEFAATGAEVLVASDHDHITEYGPVLRASRLRGLRALPGAEVSGEVESEAAPHTIGHLNAFPLPRDPEAHRGGVPAHEGRRLSEVLAALRSRSAPLLIQLNHPRADGDTLDPEAYLSHLGDRGRPFDPRRPLDEEPNRALVEADPASGVRPLDFDLIELLNGKRLDRYRTVWHDWMALLRQGVFRAATANSDSHAASQPLAVPRTYAAVPVDDPESLDVAEFLGALRKGRSFGTTGPLLFVHLEGTGPGGQATGRAGRLAVEVRAASWIPVETAVVYVNGREVHRVPVRAGEVLSLPLHLPEDGAVTVEVDGPAVGRYAELLPGFRPFAFTNPIFVDADADGRWEPPGL